MKKSNIKCETKVLRNQINSAENRLGSIKSAIKNLYIDKCSGDLPEEVFKSMLNDFLNEQAELEERLTKLNKELYEISNATDEINEWLNLISNFAKIKTLTRPIITELIDSITVSERVMTEGKWE